MAARIGLGPAKHLAAENDTNRSIRLCLTFDDHGAGRFRIHKNPRSRSRSCARQIRILSLGNVLRDSNAPEKTPTPTGNAQNREQRETEPEHRAAAPRHRTGLAGAVQMPHHQKCPTR
jgi:hypothetical protein